MTNFAEIYNPDHQTELFISDTSMFVDPEISRVTERFNSTSYEKLCQQASESLVEFGSDKTDVTCGRFSGHGYSESEAVVYWAPFSNGLNKSGNQPNVNMRLRAYYLISVMKELDITDARGDYKPLVVVAAPSGPDGLVLDSDPHKDKTARKYLAKYGQLAIGVEKQLETIALFGKFGKIACTGASLGGSESITAGAIANFDVTQVVACDPTNVMDRSALRLGMAFISQGKYLAKEVEESGVEAFSRVLTESNMAGMAKDVLSQRQINWALWQALAKNTLTDDLVDVLHRGIPTTIAYGTENAVVPQDSIEARITEAENYFGESKSDIPPVHRLMFVNGRHVWMDNLEKHAIAMAYGLTRTT